MVLGIDGADWSSAATGGRKYLEQGLRQSAIEDGRQPPNRPGGGYGFKTFNSGFDRNVRTRICGARGTLIVGFNFKINGYSGFAGSVNAMPILRFESIASSTSDGSNTRTQLMVGWDDVGRLCFSTGGGGVRFSGSAIQIGRTDGFNVPLNTYLYLELKVLFGTGGRIQLWSEDVLVYDQNLNVSQAGHVENPDRISWMFENLGTTGYTYDDNYVADILGGVNNDRLGPVRVTTVFPLVDGAAEQWSRNVGSANFQCVDDPGGGAGPDDATTELSASVGKVDLYNVGMPACYGKILAVSANLCAHGVGGLSTVDLVAQASRDPASRYDLGSGLSIPAAYIPATVPIAPSVVQAIANTSPLNNGVWRDGDIRNGLWGMRSGGDVKATQFFVEKLVSLRPQHYDCGGGSYIY